MRLNFLGRLFPQSTDLSKRSKSRSGKVRPKRRAPRKARLETLENRRVLASLLNVEIVQVCNDNGSACAELGPGDTNLAQPNAYAYENEVNAIFAQADIRVAFTYSRFNSSATLDLTTAEVNALNNGDGFRDFDGIQMFFVRSMPILDARSIQGNFSANAGISQQGVVNDSLIAPTGRGVMVNAGPDRIEVASTLAHEIAHTLGLSHIGETSGFPNDPRVVLNPNQPNLMWEAGSGPAFDTTLNNAIVANNPLTPAQINAMIANGTAARFDVLEDAPDVTVSIGAAARNVNEASGTINVTATLSVDAAADVTIPLTFGGTAGNNDRNIVNNSITITAGNRTGTAQIEIIDDAFDEVNETVIVNLGTPTGGVVVANGQQTITIADNDPQPRFSLSTANPTVNEEAQTLTFDVNLSGVTEAVASVGFQVTQNGVGVTNVSANPVQFAAGATTGTITMNLVDDNVFNETNSVVVTLVQPSDNAGINVGQSSSTISVTEDEVPPPPSVSVAAAQTVGESDNTIQVVATLSRAADDTVTIPVTVTGGTAGQNDFTVTQTEIVINAGTTGTFNLQINEDLFDEPNETIVVQLGTPTNAALSAQSSQTITITDNDAQPVFRVTPASATVNEEAQTLTFNVALSGPTEAAATLGFSVEQSGVAVTNVSSSPLVFAAGATTATITMDLIDDAVFNSTNEITVNLDSSSNNAGINANQATAKTVVTEDEMAPPATIQFTATDLSATEGGDTILIPIEIINPINSVISLPYTIQTDADAAEFQFLSPNPLIVPAGATTANIRVRAIADELTEPNETIQVSLQAPDIGSLGNAGTATVQIVDVPPTPPVIEFQNADMNLSFSESFTNAITVSLTLDKPAPAAVTATLTLGGTASGNDYNIVTTTVTIPAGAQSFSTDVTLNQDTQTEPTETLVIGLSNVSGATVGDDATQTISILDINGPANRNRILVPQFVARPHLVPGDNQPTAILFTAESDTTVSVFSVGSVSAGAGVQMLNESLVNIGQSQSGQFRAEVTEGGPYALIFPAASSDRIYVIRSSAGYDALIGSRSFNMINPTDVNADGVTTSVDAVRVINRINASEASGEPASFTSDYSFEDVNGDGSVTAVDALRIINELNSAEGRRVAASEPADAALSSIAGETSKSQASTDGPVDSIALLAAATRKWVGGAEIGDDSVSSPEVEVSTSTNEESRDDAIRLAEDWLGLE